MRPPIMSETRRSSMLVDSTESSQEKSTDNQAESGRASGCIEKHMPFLLVI